MNHKRSIILFALIAILGCIHNFSNLHAAMHAVQEQRLEFNQTSGSPTGAAPISAPIGTPGVPVPGAAPTKMQAQIASDQAAESLVKAQKAAAEAGASEKSSGDEALKLLEKLPTYGIGVLTRVSNETPYPISIQSAGAKTLNDQLAEGTIVRIKSLETKFGTNGKYYTLKKVDTDDSKSQGGFSFMPDSSDPNDKSTYFVITRRVSSDLQDWIGIMHPISDEKTLQVNPATLDVGFFNKNFQAETDTPSHWSILGTTIDKCNLRNRKTGGFLSFFSGDKEVKTTKSEPLLDMFGIEQAPFEIISATFSEEKGNIYDVTDVIKLMALKDGKIYIVGDMYEFFGKPKPSGTDTKSMLTLRIRNGKKIDEFTVPNGTTDQSSDKEKVKNINTAEKPNEFEYIIPSAAQLGSMLASTEKGWRGPVLEYNTIITMSSDFYPTYILWTHGAGFWDGRMDEPALGNPTDRYTSTGPQLLMIKAKGDPNKTGPINYEDEIEIYSLVASTGNTDDPNNKSPDKVLIPAKRWWQQFDSRWGGGYNEILIASVDDKDDRTKNSTFMLRSPNKLSGPVYQNDVVKIVSKAHIKDGKEVDDKSYLNLNLWVNGESRSGGQLRGEIFLRDPWGATNRWDDRITGEKNLTGDRMALQGGFKIQAASTNKLSDLAEKIYTAQGIKDSKVGPGKLLQLSVKSSKEVWAINAEQTPWVWNGTRWTKIPSPNPLKQICVGVTGEVWGVSIDNKIWQYIKPNWVPLGGDNMRQIALRSGTEVWGIGMDGFSYLWNGTQWQKNSPGQNSIINISVSANGNTWAIDNKQRIWRLGKDKSWILVNAPSDKAVLLQLAVRNDNDVWAISNDGSVYHWDGKAWTKQDGRLSYIAVASGSKTIVIKTEKKTVNGPTTTDVNNKPITDPTSAVKFEIVQLGIGGNLPAGKTVQINIPVTKSPTVSGFAATQIERFQPGSKLIVIPLLGRGGAWPENVLSVPGRTTISFLARAEDAGDIQVLFGPEISDNYTWKVVIGGWNNTKSAIIKRTVVGGQPKETIMFEITKKQNPLAATSPGNFTPYWVSYDKGFIMAGMGLPGENVFMAYRVNETSGGPEITRVGFGSNKTNVEYSEIQFFPPVIIEKPDRVYAQSADTISLGANQTTFTWTKFPFRSDDRGTVGFEIQGTDNVVLALGQQASNNAPHYAIVFGSDKASITIKKWNPTKKVYADRAILPKSKASGLSLDSTKSIPVWVSYQDGLIAIGTGDVGQNPVLVYQDINNYDGIHTVGFGNFGPNPATVRNLQATPPVLMHLDLKNEAFQAGQTWYQFNGGVTIIMPFEYQFVQKGASVIATDLLSKEIFYSGATPGGGNLFKFLLKISANGFPELVWETPPENATQTKVKQTIAQTAAAAELQKAKADAQAKEAALVHATATAESKKIAKTGASLQAVADTMTGAASAVAIAAQGGGGLAATTAIGMGGIVASGIASKFLQDAAKTEYEGAQAESILRKKSLELEASSNQLRFQSNIIAGSAEVAFKDPKAYVYVDDPQKSALGTATLSPETLANGQKANELMAQADQITPKDQKNFELMVSLLQDIVFLITNASVATDQLKQKFIQHVLELNTAYSTLFSAKPDPRVTNNFINLLFTAINKGYLISPTTDADIRNGLYSWINNIARNLLTKLPSITLKACYGEYIWLPVQLAQDDLAILEITVEGREDVFVCFAQKPESVRNTSKDIYEVVLAGWDNTKHAIRIQSLGRSVKEFTKDDYPDTMMNPYQPQTYRIMLNNGTITINVQGKNLTWKDPYPIKGIKWVGISNWESEVNFKKISLKMPKAATGSTATQKIDATAGPTADAPAAIAPDATA